MSWPTPAEINEAVQNPQLSFHDPELSAGQAETDPLGIPLARSGSNADVYCFTCGGERVAVKCFTRPIAHLEHRYREVHSVLSTLKLPFTVDCRYQPQGIWLQETWYPLVRMQWVDGIRLNEFVQSVVGRKEMLAALVQILSKMGDWLELNRLGHCDLQHGNILLIPSQGGRKLALRLVDYDGMWVPALAGDPPQEFGHPDYQHPARAASGYYGPAVDRFSLLAIATGLRGVIAHGGELWNRYDNSVNILFAQKDYLDPHRSPLLAELSRSKDDLVRRLCGALGEACAGPLDGVRPLSEILRGTALVSAPAGVPLAEPVEVLPLPDEDEPPAAPGAAGEPLPADEGFGPEPPAGEERRKARDRHTARSKASKRALWAGLAAGALLFVPFVIWAALRDKGTGHAAAKSPAPPADQPKPVAPEPKKTDPPPEDKKPEPPEDKGQAAIKAYRRDPRGWVAGSTWQFYRNVNGQRTWLGNLTLARNGRILGSKHPNETTWNIRGTSLLFLNRQGRATTAFDLMDVEGDKLIFSGVFMNGTRSHELHRELK